MMGVVVAAEREEGRGRRGGGEREPDAVVDDGFLTGKQEGLQQRGAERRVAFGCSCPRGKSKGQ